MEQFRLKKTRKKLFVSTYAFIATLLVGAGVYTVINFIANTNAEEDYAFGLDEDSFAFDIGLDNYTEPDHYEYELDKGISYESTVMGHQQGVNPLYDIAPDENFVARYDSTNSDDCQNSMGCVSQVENQKSENLCWAYSYTTAIESTIRNQLFDTDELSVKHLDYQLANNFLNDASNPYYVYLYGNSNSSGRSISGSANYQLASIVTTGKNTLVSEQTFWQNFKNADNALSSYNSYAEYLLNNSNGYRNKISSDIVLDESNSEVNLASYEVASNFIYYGEDAPLQNSNTTYSYSREAFIRHLKAAIRDYGAVGVNTHYNKTKCGYTESNNFTIIDKTTRSNTSYCGGPHAVTLVGWDDNWAYRNGEEDKKGAFIIQESYGQTTNKEYLAYESAITGFFIATEVEKNNYDHVYDYTDQLSSSQSNITPAANDLIFEFNAKGLDSEKIEKISFSQRFKMSGNVYTAYLSTDGGESWEWLGNLQYFYPGLKSLDLSKKDIELDGPFAIKIHSGKVSKDGCVVIRNPSGSGNIRECTLPLDPDDPDLLGIETIATPEPIDYEGEDFNNSEKKYDLVNVYTTDVVEKNEHTVTFVTNNEDYVTLSKTSITVPDGATLIKSGSTLTFKDADNEIIDSVDAVLNIGDNDRDDAHYTYSVSWDIGNLATVNGDMTILARYEREAKKFQVLFSFKYQNDTGEWSKTTWNMKDLEYGVMPVYAGRTIDINWLAEEGTSYEFVGWEPEIVPVTEDAEYFAVFNIVTDDDNGQGQSDDPGGNSQGDNQNQGGGQDDIHQDNQGSPNQNHSNQGGSGSTTPSVPSTSPGKDDNDTTVSEGGSSSGSSKSGSRVANTGYGQTENNFIRADAFITAMILGTIGFVVYIIKNRRHLRLRPS